MTFNAGPFSPYLGMCVAYWPSMHYPPLQGRKEGSPPVLLVTPLVVVHKIQDPINDDEVLLIHIAAGLKMLRDTREIKS